MRLASSSTKSSSTNQADQGQNDDYQYTFEKDGTHITLDAMVNAAFHVGGTTLHPANRAYIYGKRHRSFMINPEKTLVALRSALMITRAVAAQGGQIVFADERPLFREIVRREAKRCGQHVFTKRWQPGWLTNRDVVKSEFWPDLFVFFHVGIFGGSCINETRRVGIPTIGVISTSCDPSRVTYPILVGTDNYAPNVMLPRLFSNAVLEGQQLKGQSEDDILRTSLRLTVERQQHS